MAPIRKPQTKVVDNLKTQLQDLLNTLNQLHEKINLELNRFGSGFDEINTVLIEGFRNVMEQKPPIDVVESASSSTGDDDDYDSSESEDNCSVVDDVDDGMPNENGDGIIIGKDKRGERQAQAKQIMNMVQSWMH
ncbi:hypothetical protein RDWZM_000910 [Blomia tropicalis]|uniref:Uncharacterized protein n=1 Tax=Blomia tropicalis TaxID=40697 RepID=A0A9Q0MEX2_BLOTA|nr:hypothetical protein BLOT_015234 [Blomia tropicalis]KAJ6222365.1 hypothetical protein RDWZM_000910 [Blomia tropicalis]